jgi:hypothetical protein
MTYEECVRSAFLDRQSWSVLLIGLGLALGLRKFGRKYSAVAIAISSAIVGLVLAYTYFELNCVELYLG